MKKKVTIVKSLNIIAPSGNQFNFHVPQTCKFIEEKDGFFVVHPNKVDDPITVVNKVQALMFKMSFGETEIEVPDEEAPKVENEATTSKKKEQEPQVNTGDSSTKGSKETTKKPAKNKN